MACKDITKKWLQSKEAKDLKKCNEKIQEIFVEKCWGSFEQAPIEEVEFASIWFQKDGIMYFSKFICDQEGNFSEINY